MTTAYTTFLGLALPVTGELSGTWGDTVNDYITQYLDASVAGTQTISGSQTAVTLSKTTNSALAQAGSGATGSAQYNIINCTGNPAGTLTVTISYPTLTNAQFSKSYLVINSTSTSQSVVVQATTSSGTSTGTTLVSGEKALIAWNGSDFIKVATSTVDGVSTIAFGTTGLTPSAATSGAVTVAGTLVAANGGTGQSTYTTGDLLYATGSTALSKLGIGTNGQILTSTGTAPQWSTLSGVAVTTFSAGTTGFTPSSATSGAITLAGTLATTNGGTGLTSFTANRVFYASSTSAIGQSANLTFDGTTLTAANFTDSSLTSGRVTYATTGGNLTDSANLLYSGTDLTVYGITVGRGASAISTNTVVGSGAMAAITTGNFTSAFGADALKVATTGPANDAFGYSALKATTTGERNAAFGAGSLLVNTSGSSNISVGNDTMASNTTGSFNTAVGRNALYSNTTASNNTAVGYQAGYSNTTGANNTTLGTYSGYSINGGAQNTFVGNGAGYYTTTGTDNVAVGFGAFAYNSAYGTGNYNVAIGREALSNNTTASNNTAVGYQALYSNITGYNHVAIGYQAGYSSGSVDGCIFIGQQAGYASTAKGNTIIGSPVDNSRYAAGRYLTSGASNTALGVGALSGSPSASLTGSNNTAIGYGSGSAITSGSSNTILGGYSGNQGGLDIRTANNRIVLSDGDGNPRLVGSDQGSWSIGPTSYPWSASGSWLALDMAGRSLAETGAGAGDFTMVFNAYYSYANSRWQFDYTGDRAARYSITGNGEHTWYGSTSVAPSADSAVTFTQLLQFKLDNTLALQGATIQSGIGITFPASQAASSNANTLDDYEEGTWTPAVRGASTAGTYELSVAEGSYVKIGKQVTLTCRVVFAASITGGGTGYMQITGAPSFNNSAVSAGSVWQTGLDMTAGYTWLSVSHVSSSGTNILYFPESGDALISNDFPISGVSSGDAFYFTITYLAST